MKVYEWWADIILFIKQYNIILWVYISLLIFSSELAFLSSWNFKAISPFESIKFNLEQSYLKKAIVLMMKNYIYF